MNNQLAQAAMAGLTIGEEKKEREIMLAEDAYNEQWRDQVDWGPQDPEPGEPVFGTEEGGQTFFEFVKSLQISPQDVEMAMEMWPNLRGIGVNVPSADDTGASDDYYGTPSNNPDMPDGWQLANLLNDLTITGGNKNAAKNLKILKGADRGVPNADRFVEKKGLGAILPNLDQASLTPEALNALRKGTKKGLSSREIRDLIKPFTQKDQFGHPSGKLI